MGDVIVQLIMLPLAIMCVVISIRFSERWINPVSIVFVGFFLPLVAATFRLSDLQARSWLPDTYLALLLIFGSWLFLPTLIIVAKGKVGNCLEVSDKLRTGHFAYVSRVFALIVVAAYFISNYIQAGTLLPILFPEIAYRLHTDFPPVLRLFARCIPAAVGISYVAFAFHRKKIDLLIIVIAVITPITRLSRIDVMLSAVVLVIVFSALPLFKMNAKRLMLLLATVSVVAIGVVELGNQRTNRFGLYKVEYGQAIKWNADIAGPAGVFPVLYGYFPLSFENFDSFIAHAGERRGDGLSSFDWFFTGIVKLNRLATSDNGSYGSFIPVSSAANVPTALLPFFNDFGLLGMVFPAALYMVVLVWFFYKSARDVVWLLLFGVFSAAFSLASFQALVAAPIIFHQLLFISVVFLIARYFGGRGLSNSS
ncbi:MAG: hypothetical protein H6Q72_4612 [Firmicutes bacterium]|nr:hypothetical protein [Bacillota bacterium]